MADIIGTEAQAKSIGNSGASATSNLCVTKVRALALNCGITNASSYANNLLVRYKDLYCNHSTCCVSQCCVSQCCVSLCCVTDCGCQSQCCVSQCCVNDCGCLNQCCVNDCCVSQCCVNDCCVNDCCVNMCQCATECSPDCCVNDCCVTHSSCCVSQCTCKSSNCVRYTKVSGYCGCDWVCTCYLGCTWNTLDAGYSSYCNCHSCSQESACGDCCQNNYVCTNVSD